MSHPPGSGRHVLKKVETAGAQGREQDIYAARLTQEAFEQATESMTAITNHFDVDTLLMVDTTDPPAPAVLACPPTDEPTGQNCRPFSSFIAGTRR